MDFSYWLLMTHPQYIKKRLIRFGNWQKIFIIPNVFLSLSHHPRACAFHMQNKSYKSKLLLATEFGRNSSQIERPSWVHTFYRLIVKELVEMWYYHRLAEARRRRSRDMNQLLELASYTPWNPCILSNRPSKAYRNATRILYIPYIDIIESRVPQLLYGGANDSMMIIELRARAFL